jgi:hypothetical protein
MGLAGDLLFLLQPPVQDPQAPVAGGDGLRRPALEQLAEEGLQVLAAGVQQAAAAAGEGLGLAEAFQVAGDGVLGAVLGPQVPLEGADQAGAVVGVSWPDRSPAARRSRDGVNHRYAAYPNRSRHEDDQRFRWSGLV